MEYRKIFLTRLLQLFLCVLSCLNFIDLLSRQQTEQQQIGEDELYRLEKMANEMLAQLSPEEREQAMAMAQQMEQELAQLPPEKLAEVEAALKQDVQYLLSDDSPYKQFAEPITTRPEYQAPTEPVEPVEPEDQTTGQNAKENEQASELIKKKSVDPAKLQATKLLLQNIIKSLDEILLKAQTLPRISDDRAQEKHWQELYPEITQLKSTLAIIAEKPVLMAQLLETKFSELDKSLQKLGKGLNENTRKLQVLKKLDAIIEQLTKLGLSQIRIESQKLIKEFTPEALNDFTAVGAKWHQADYRQQKDQDPNLSSRKTPRTIISAPQQLATQLETELFNLQELIQTSQLELQLEQLAKINHQSKSNVRDLPTRTTIRQLEADLIRVNLQYERLLRILVSVVGKSYQLAPELSQLLLTKVNGANSEIKKIEQLVGKVLAVELELTEQIKKQLLKLAAQASELNSKISLLTPAKTVQASKPRKTNSSQKETKKKVEKQLNRVKFGREIPPAA